MLLCSVQRYSRWPVLVRVVRRAVRGVVGQSAA